MVFVTSPQPSFRRTVSVKDVNLHSLQIVVDGRCQRGQEDDLVVRQYATHFPRGTAGRDRGRIDTTDPINKLLSRGNKFALLRSLRITSEHVASESLLVRENEALHRVEHQRLGVVGADPQRHTIADTDSLVSPVKPKDTPVVNVSNTQAGCDGTTVVGQSCTF